MGAIAERITDPDEMEKAGRLMDAKFPGVEDFVEAETHEYVLFRVTSKVVSVLDYSKGFGHTDLVEL